MKEIGLYSKRIRELENQCFNCGFVWDLYNAGWEYNKNLKRKLPVCPKCNSGIIIHIPD